MADIVRAMLVGNLVTEPPQNEGFVDQDQVERFSVKREHNQHR
jgi:hypothetical protein